MFFTVHVAISLFTFSIVQADLQNCNGYKEINPPANLNDSYYWPDGWTEKQTLLQFAANQKCTWKFNVPKGMYAYFGSSLRSQSPTTLLKFTDSRGVLYTFNDTDFNFPYFPVSPGFSVELDSTAVGSLGMRVAWFPIPITKPLEFAVAPSQMPLVIDGDTFNNVTTIHAQQRVSLVSLKANQARENEDIPTMRLTLVFDGPDTNSKFLGNLWDVVQSGQHLVSSGSSITLLTVWPETNSGNKVVLQEYSNVQNMKTISGINCYLNEDCTFTLDATNGPAAGVRYYEDSHYLSSSDIPPTSLLQVYSGLIDQKFLMASYGPSSSIQSLPQRFRSSLTIYTLDKGVGKFTITGKQPNEWGSVSSKRRQGVIVSKNYGVSNVDQEFSEVFSSNEMSNITLTVRDAGLTAAASLRVIVTGGGKTVSDETYNAGKSPNSVTVYQGSQLNVVYLTKGISTEGCFVEFYFEKNEASVLSLTSALIVMLYYFY